MKREWFEVRVRIYREAMYFYNKNLCLPENKKRLDLVGSDEWVAMLRLGWAPNEWDALIRHMDGYGITPEILVEAGLAVKRVDGTGYYDLFRERFVIPIFLFAPMGKTPVGMVGVHPDAAANPAVISTPGLAHNVADEALWRYWERAPKRPEEA